MSCRLGGLRGEVVGAASAVGACSFIDDNSYLPLVLQRRLTSADLDFSLCQTGTVLKRGWLCDPLIRSFKRGSPNPSL